MGSAVAVAAARTAAAIQVPLKVMEVDADFPIDLSKVAPTTDWADLPIDLLAYIADQVVYDVACYIRLCAVCKAWRSALAYRLFGKHLPWLLLQYKDRRLSFFSIVNSRTFTVPIPTAMEDAPSKTIGGCCNGWLLIEDNKKLTISLLNPLTGAHLELPATTELINSKELNKLIMYEKGKKTERKIMSAMILALAMSDDPASGRDCTVVVVSLWSWHLVSIRVGDDGWKLMDGNAKYHDVIYRGGRFYAVDQSCGLTIFDDAGINKLTFIPSPTFRCFNSLFWRFVEVAGELLLIRRGHGEVPVYDGYMHPPKYSTSRFDIYKLKHEGHDMSLEEVTDFGDNVLFYGFSNGLACSVAEYPGGKPNAVYCTEVYTTRVFDSNLICYVEPGVFDMATAKVEPLPNWTQIEQSIGCFSMWFIPNFQ